MKSLSRPELDAVLAEAKGDDIEAWLVLSMLFNHGLRVSEVVGGWSKIDGEKVYHRGLYAENVVNGRLETERLKGSNGAIHPLFPEEIEHLAGRTGKLFHMSRTTVWRRMQKYGEAVGIARALRHPHTMKHTCGRLAYVGGMPIPDIVEYLGHKNESNALKYMKSNQSEAAAAFAQAMGRGFGAAAGAGL
jgi:integrase